MKNTTSRNPLMAAIMSLILPGFGQLYNGHVNRGLLIFIAFCLCSVPLVLWVALSLPTALTLPLVAFTVIVSLGLWLYGVIDAYRSAKKLRNYTLQNWQMPAMYLTIFLVAAFLIIPAATNYVRDKQVESFHIPSRSMEPSVLQGDILFTDKSYNCIRCRGSVKRGDIGVFVYPNNRTLYYLKRVIGLPGETIHIENRQVFINGESLSKAVDKVGDKYISVEKSGELEYQVQWSVDDITTMEPMIVPQGEVFVLGDNRSASNDSRKFGTVPVRDVVGQASQVWFSKSAEGLRWDRFGLVLK